MRRSHLEIYQDRRCVFDAKHRDEQRRKFPEEEVPVLHHEQLLQDHRPRLVRGAAQARPQGGLQDGQQARRLRQRSFMKLR